MQEEILKARVVQMRQEARTIVSLELQPCDGISLPAYEPGAHIDLHLGDGIRRSYSLIRPYERGGRYALAVHTDEASRGGSRYVHQVLRVGDEISISAPKNNFPLDMTADKSVLIAGGIGITPILCMAAALERAGKDWSVHYAARGREMAAFVAELKRLDPGGRVHLHFDDEGTRMDIGGIMARHEGADFYCCGPLPMLGAFEAAASALPKGKAHIEYFAPAEAAARDGGFEIELRKSGKTFEVPSGSSILEVLLTNKVNVPFSCSEGVCGTCETRVLEGIPDHRDAFLTEEERVEGRTMMVCCSGAKSDRLVLDL